MTISQKTIEEQYQEFCNTPSDINEHLPTLRKYYDECAHVTEIGVRGCVSLHAALASKAKKVVAIDILNVAVPICDKLDFICANDLEIEIEPTDFLFIDSLHTYKQLKAELNLHSKNVRKYIGGHDTFMFGASSEDGTTPGLLQAIAEFLSENKDWAICYSTNNNNGLTILSKQ